MDKKGFALVETIIVIVVLTVSLLLLYSSFSRIIHAQKKRINYDDVSLIYRSSSLEAELKSFNFNAVLSSFSESDLPYMTIGVDTALLFEGYQDQKTYFTNFLNDNNISQILLIKTIYVDDMKNCTEDECPDLTHDLLYYVKSVDVDRDDFPSSTILIVEYTECANVEISDDVSKDVCKNYYSWVTV